MTTRIVAIGIGWEVRIVDEEVRVDLLSSTTHLAAAEAINLSNAVSRAAWTIIEEIRLRHRPWTRSAF